MLADFGSLSNCCFLDGLCVFGCPLPIPLLGHFTCLLLLPTHEEKLLDLNVQSEFRSLTLFGCCLQSCFYEEILLVLLIDNYIEFFEMCLLFNDPLFLLLDLKFLESAAFISVISMSIDPLHTLSILLLPLTLILIILVKSVLFSALQSFLLNLQHKLCLLCIFLRCFHCFFILLLESHVCESC